MNPFLSHVTINVASSPFYIAVTVTYRAEWTTSYTVEYTEGESILQISFEYYSKSFFQYRVPENLYMFLYEQMPSHRQTWYFVYIPIDSHNS